VAAASVTVVIVSDFDAVVRGLMRDVGAALRPWGFRGSGRVWRLVTDEGVAVVEKQAAARSWQSETGFYLNTAVVPTTWWAWNRATGLPIGKAGSAHGIRLLERRVASADRGHADGWDRWRVAADTDVDGLRADLLAGVTGAAGRLTELLAPGRYLDELLAVPDKKVGHWQAVVVLLADRGPSAELDAAYAGAREAYAGRPRAADFVEELIAWSRARAAGVAQTGAPGAG
jgi:hypothetical protein